MGNSSFNRSIPLVQSFVFPPLSFQRGLGVEGSRVSPRKRMEIGSLCCGSYFVVILFMTFYSISISRP